MTETSQVRDNHSNTKNDRRVVLEAYMEELKGKEDQENGKLVDFPDHYSEYLETLEAEGVIRCLFTHW